MKKNAVLRRALNVTNLLLAFGFVISMTSIMIGVGAVDSILKAMAQNADHIPLYDSLADRGVALFAEIYFFSMANCVVASNYWIVTKRREMAVRKAFGWSNIGLCVFLAAKLGRIAAVSMVSGGILAAALGNINEYFKVNITPFFAAWTMIILIFTMAVSMIIPVRGILKIKPAEVIA